MEYHIKTENLYIVFTAITKGHPFRFRYHVYEHKTFKIYRINTKEETLKHMKNLFIHHSNQIHITDNMLRSMHTDLAREKSTNDPSVALNYIESLLDYYIKGKDENRVSVKFTKNRPHRIEFYFKVIRSGNEVHRGLIAASRWSAKKKLTKILIQHEPNVVHIKDKIVRTTPTDLESDRWVENIGSAIKFAKAIMDYHSGTERVLRVEFIDKSEISDHVYFTCNTILNDIRRTVTLERVGVEQHLKDVFSHHVTRIYINDKMSRTELTDIVRNKWTDNVLDASNYVRTLLDYHMKRTIHVEFIQLLFTQPIMFKYQVYEFEDQKETFFFNPKSTKEHLEGRFDGLRYQFHIKDSIDRYHPTALDENKWITSYEEAASFVEQLVDYHLSGVM